MVAPVIAAAILFVGLALLSLGWGIEHDVPYFCYLGFLVGHEHRMPYRDLFEVNLPGTFFIFMVLDKLIGPHDLGFRIADVTLLGLLSGLTWKLLRPFGWMPALIGPTLFGLYYLHDSPMLSLQREFLILQFLAPAILLAADWKRSGTGWRAFWVGASVGLATLIKPQAILFLPALIVFLPAPVSRDAEPARPAETRRGHWLRILALGAVGSALPVLLAATWLAANGALKEYAEIARRYYPLYSHLSGMHQTLRESERRGYLLREWFIAGGMHWWMITAGLGVVLGFRGAPAPRRRLVWLLVALTAISSILPPTSGQFYDYHWMPFFYFLAILSSLSLSRATPESPPFLRAVAAAVLVLVAVLHTQTRLPTAVKGQLAGLPYQRQLAGRVSAIDDYLRLHLQPGDTVQPLDWTGGSADALWRARTPLATRFMSDLYFYHHVSTPYIQSLRKRFIDELSRARPRVIVEIQTDKPWAGGHDTTREFPALQRYIRENYVPDLIGDGFVIHLRREAPRDSTGG